MNRALDELRKLKKDPIYGILGDFAGEMIEQERDRLAALDAASEEPPQPEPENAPNEAKPRTTAVNDASAEPYDPRTEHEQVLADLRATQTSLAAALSRTQEPAEAG